MKQILLFYSTLQLENVQKKSFSRILDGEPDILIGFRIGQLKITDEFVLGKSQQLYPPIAVPTGNPNDLIEGTLFEIYSIEFESRYLRSVKLQES